MQAADSPTRVQSAIEAAIRNSPQQFREEVRTEPPVATSLLAGRLLVLRAPDASRQVKGVLLLMFTGQFSDFTQAVDVRRLCDDYTIVLEPSYSGYADSAILQFQSVAPHPVIVMATESRDFAFLQRLGSNLVPVKLGSSDWVDPSLFARLDGVTKRYDCIMVAGWERLKRHHALFRAVAQLGDPTFQVCLIGSSWIRSRREVEDLVTFFGLEGQVTLFEKLSPEEVNLRLNESRFNVLMSRREGSNRSLFEGMFADVPALALEGVIGPNRQWLAGRGGRLTNEESLSATLREMRASASEYRPREWALQHFAPDISTRTLAAAIQQATGTAQAPVAEPLVTKVNAPELRYADATTAHELPTALTILATYARER